MTARTLGPRVDEHVVVSYRTGARLTKPPHSAIRDHRDSCCIFNLTPDILKYYQMPPVLLIKEF